ncbi:MAG: molybdenum cofactor guanylyltransferase [Clostridiales bacterium]|nr:molybdenum cofactor guanylyltransferase [Clostridiales bacterium]MCF8021130.1 molybdenum cofactor guanylyltransferase [Clostridiales bacterium]
MYKLTGIIMAGGKNSRMGMDKALLRVGERTIVEKNALLFKAAAGRVMIVTSRPEDFAFLGLETTSDIFPGCGPLGGIHAGLTYSRSNVNLVTACDMPFLEVGLLKYLASYGEAYDVVVPRINGYLEPLVACYNKTCLKIIENCLKEKNLKITSFFDQVNVRYVEENEIAEIADPERVFFNINTPRELERAKLIENKQGLPHRL